MQWNWQYPDWPEFIWDATKLVKAERLFAEGAGVIIGAGRHLENDDQESLTIEIMSLEALDTSAIEGEVLNRESVQSSIRRQLGLATDRRKSEAAEAGIAEMMVALNRNLPIPLDQETLFDWHKMITNGRRDLIDIGRYRRHAEPMQIVSGPDYATKVHFEAPPSTAVPSEMERFFAWLHNTSPTGACPLPPITRAGIAHIWFESIHPFEDGNGRIGRAIIEKTLAQGLSTPVLTAVAGTLLRRRKKYYQSLAHASQTLNINDWLLWFASAVIESQQRGLAMVEFILHKAKLLNRVRDKLNPRQEKAVLRLFSAGPEGFIGGLSASNYMSITGAPSATTTRDLSELVELKVIQRTGERKATRYHLAIPLKAVQTVRVEDLC